MTNTNLEKEKIMLSNEEIAEYKRLKKDVDEANVEKQTMKAEIKVFVQQGKEKLANSFKDTKKAAAFNALLLGAILCKNNGIDSSQMLDILSAAGVK